MRDYIIEAYINEIIAEIYRVESLKSNSSKMDPTFLSLWINNIEQACENMYEDYLMGKREHYYMSIKEYEEIFDNAGMTYSESLLDSLIDSDFVTAEISKEGKILYKKNNL